MKIKLLFCSLILLAMGGHLHAQDFVQSYNFINTGTNGPTTSFASTGVTSFFIQWSPQTTVFTCAVQVDSSADGISWGSGDLIASQKCDPSSSATTNSAGPAALASGKFFVRIHITALTGNGGVNVTLKGWGGSGGGITSNVTIDVGSQVGANFNTQQINNATITSGSAIVTAPSGTFTSSDAGKNAVGFNICNTGQIAQADAPVIGETTILSVQSSSQVTLNASATNNGSCFFWGTPDDPAFTAADTAAAAATSCPAINLPAKMGWVEKAHFIQSLPTCSRTSAGNGGQVVGWGEIIRGQGKGASSIFIAPNLKNNLAGCTGGPSANACFFGQQGQNLRDFSMTGGDNIASGFGSAKELFEFTNYTVLSNTLFNNFGGNDANDSIQIGSIVMWDSNFSGMPSFSVANETFNNLTFLFSSAFQSNCATGGQLMSIAASARVVSTGTSYSFGVCLNGSGGNPTLIRNSGNYYSYGDFFFDELTTNFGVGAFTNAAATSKAFFYGTLWQSIATNNAFEPINNAVSGAYMYLSGVTLNCGTNIGIANNVSGATIINGGGNQITGCNANPLLNPAGANIPIFAGSATQTDQITNPSQIVASRLTSLGATTLLAANSAWAGGTTNYEIRLYAYDSAAGSGCSTNTTVTWTFNYTDPTGTAQTSTATETIITNGGATGADALKVLLPITAKSGTAITYSTTYAIGTCTTGPSYAAQIGLY